MRLYITSQSEAFLWQDLERLAHEKEVLAVFRSPETRFGVETKYPEFRIQKARATRRSTVFWSQITGSTQQFDTHTQVQIRVGFTSEAQLRNAIAGMFLLVWPPFWFMLINPSNWVWALPLTIVFGNVVAIIIYWPIWTFKDFLVKRWKLKPQKH